MSADRFTLDTNILVYAIDRDAEDKHRRAVSIINQAMDIDCVLTLQALCELYSSATRKKYASHDEITNFIQKLMIVFPVVASSSKTLSKALKTVEEHGVSFWDALLWATAKENGCCLILSEDFQDGRVLEGIQIKNPFSSDDLLESFF